MQIHENNFSRLVSEKLVTIFKLGDAGKYLSLVTGKAKSKCVILMDGKLVPLFSIGLKSDRAPNLGLVERFNFGLLPRFNLSLVARFNFGLST